MAGKHFERSRSKNQLKCTNSRLLHNREVYRCSRVDSQRSTNVTSTTAVPSTSTK